MSALVAISTGLTLTLTVLLIIQLHRLNRTLHVHKDPVRSNRMLMRMLGLVGIWELTVALDLIAFGGEWALVIPLVALGICLLWLSRHPALLGLP